MDFAGTLSRVLSDPVRRPTHAHAPPSSPSSPSLAVLSRRAPAAAASAVASAASVAPSVAPSDAARKSPRRARRRLRQGQPRGRRRRARSRSGRTTRPTRPTSRENDGRQQDRPWELGDPTNGKGFESAVGYAIAEQLGFAKDEVVWIVVPFANAFAPGRQDLRPRPQPGLVQARARRDGRPDRWLLLRQPVAGRAQEQPARDGHVHRRRSRTTSSAPRSAPRAMTRSPTSSPRPRSRRSSTRTTRPSRRSARARSTASSSTCRPPTSSRTSSSRTRRSSVSSRAARPSTSARSWPRTAR